jgi:glycosyltransferase involved in cell wall biosynthesis
METTIAVVIPAYNCAGYIRDTLESVFSQTVRPSEVIVVDDGSTDDLATVLQSYAGQITSIRQAHAGAAAARNTGIRAATSELVAFLDGDDIWFPDALESQLACLQRTGADAVYGDCVFMGSYLNGMRFMELFPSDGPATLEAVLARRCNVMGSVLATRAALLQTGGFAPGVGRCDDFDMWVRMLVAGCTFGYHRGLIMKHRRQRQAKVGGELSNLLDERSLYRRFLLFCQTPAQTGIVLLHIAQLTVLAAVTRIRLAVPPDTKRSLKRMLFGVRQEYPASLGVPK